MLRAGRRQSQGGSWHRGHPGHMQGGWEAAGRDSALTSPRLYFVLLQLIDLHLGARRETGLNGGQGAGHQVPAGLSLAQVLTMGDL